VKLLLFSSFIAGPYLLFSRCLRIIVSVCLFEPMYKLISKLLPVCSFRTLETRYLFSAPFSFLPRLITLPCGKYLSIEFARSLASRFIR